jgi:DNA polymerase III sliding clamp (beta) subunit (PCNA family)
MSWACEVKELLRVIRVVSKAVSAGAVAPEHGYIKLDLEPKRAMISSFNGIMGIRMELSVKGDAKQEVVIGGERFAKYFSTFDQNTSANVLIDVTSRNVIFRVDGGTRLSVACPVMTFPLHTIPNPSGKPVQLAEPFFNSAALFLSSTGGDEARPMTTNSLVDFNKGIIWSTNGPALSECRISPTKTSGGSIIIPNSLIATLKFVHEMFKTSFDLYTLGTSVIAVSKDSKIVLEHPLPLFQYPDFEPLLGPYRKDVKYVVAEKAEFLTRFYRIGALVDDADNIFVLSCKPNRLTLKFGTADSSDVEETMPCKGGITKEIVLTHGILKPFLDVAAKCKGDKIKFGFSPTGRGVVVDIDEPILYSLLPVIL